MNEVIEWGWLVLGWIERSETHSTDLSFRFLFYLPFFFFLQALSQRVRVYASYTNLSAWFILTWPSCPFAHLHWPNKCDKSHSHYWLFCFRVLAASSQPS